MAKKHVIHFIGRDTHCHFIKDNEIYMTRRSIHDMYILDFKVFLPHAMTLYIVAYGNVSLKKEHQSLQVWHHHLGRLYYGMIKKMVNNGIVPTVKYESI